MSDFTVTRTRIRNGIWEGVVQAAHRKGDRTPALEVIHLDQPVRTLSLSSGEPGEWHLRIAIPPDRLSDGIQVFLINDTETGETLDRFAVITGEANTDDLYAEVGLLRAELEMLKKTLRRIALENR